jgi:hypothetical protein
MPTTPGQDVVATATALTAVPSRPGGSSGIKRLGINQLGIKRFLDSLAAATAACMVLAPLLPTN